MKKRCNFKVPNPFVVLSNHALKRSGYRKYIIYPDLSRFKKACLNCRFKRVENKRSFCRLNDPEFMLKYYGIVESLPKGVIISVGTVPARLKPHPLAVRVEAYLEKYRQKPKNKLRLRAKNKYLKDRSERRSCFTGKQSKPVV